MDRNKHLEFNNQQIQVLRDFFPNGVVALDFEMTGLSPVFDKIIEIAVVKIAPNGESSHYATLVNPLIPIPVETQQYHEIQDSQVANMPGINKPFKEMMRFIGELPIIAHNAQFDIGFLMKAAFDLGYKLNQNEIYDSCSFARGLYKKRGGAPENFKLNTLCEYFSLDLEHHMALADAYASMAVFAHCLMNYQLNPKKKSFKEFAYQFSLNQFKPASAYLVPDHLQELSSLVSQKSEFHIKYKGGSRGNAWRKVKAYALINLPQGLVLYAKCLETDYNKHFFVKKIKNLQQHLNTEANP